jgi:hypothetical protein
VISKDEFSKIVREMQAAGTPLTVRNLMVRTELPRATVEQWLEDLQSGADLVPKAEPKRKPDEEPSRGARVKDKPRPSDDDESIFSRAKSLKDEVVGDVVKSQLGFEPKDAKANGKDKKSIATGAILGLVFPPAAFAYAAPIVEGVLATVIYLAIAIGVQKIPIIGGLLGIYVVLALNLLGAAMGLAYAFRFNRNGKRMPLLPKGGDKNSDD